MATRLSVNINDATAATLRRLAEENDTTVTEIVRKAVSVYEFFERQAKEDKKIQVVDDTSVTEVALVG